MKNRQAGLIAVSVVLALVLLACEPVGPDRARYILPPGNYGGLPTTNNSRNQIPLYDGLTPLRGNVTDADINRLYLPEDFKPIGATHEVPTGRPGTTITYDSYGIPHVTGRTRADVAFGAGWVTARDRGLLLQLGRGPARAAVADIPGINAFGLVTSAQSFVPSAATEQLVTDQIDLIKRTYGVRGDEMLADMQAEADGMTGYFRAHGINQPPATVNDVIAVTAFIGSIFGAGGGAEASNAEFLSRLQNHLGADKGRKVWEDAMLFDDPEAPTTLKRTFNYGIFTGGRVTGSAVIDEASIVSLDPRPAPAPVGRGTGGRHRVGQPCRPPHPGHRIPDHRILTRFAHLPGRGEGAVQAGFELPRRQPGAFGHPEHARGDGAAARLLLPGDRRADPSVGPRHRGAGRRRAGGDDVRPDRPDARLRMEPHLRQSRRARRLRRAALQPGRLVTHSRVEPLPVPRGVPSVRDVRRGNAQRHADPLPGVRARARDRYRDVERPARRAHAQALHVRA